MDQKEFDLFNLKARRERIATQALQGLLARHPEAISTKWAAGEAVRAADMLIKELDK